MLRVWPCVRWWCLGTCGSSSELLEPGVELQCTDMAVAADMQCHLTGHTCMPGFGRESLDVTDRAMP